MVVKMENTENKVWIELEQKSSEEDRQLQCRLANNMLRRLNDGEPVEDKFWWSTHENRYCYGGPHGYLVLSENGNWFNLDHLGREFETDTDYRSEK